MVLVESAASHKLYALKRITCHAQNDEKVRLNSTADQALWCLCI